MGSRFGSGLWRFCFSLWLYFVQGMPAKAALIPFFGFWERVLLLAESICYGAIPKAAKSVPTATTTSLLARRFFATIADNH